MPDEAASREVVMARIGAALSAWGYSLVETPVVERLDMLEAGAGPLSGTAFTLSDTDGRLLALRPDLTVPIARMAAARLADKPGPHRLRYLASVFREHESLRGQARQFTQAGIELIGTAGPAADAEVISALVEALRSAGLPRFTVAVGSVEVLSAVVAAAGMDAAWGEAVVAAAHGRDLVGIDRLSRAEGVAPAAGEALRAVPRLRGTADAVDACGELTAGFGCQDALDALAETFALLEAGGIAGEVIADFSVMRSFDYYTGIVIEAYAPGVGVPLGGGGRYDGVLGRLGQPSPAAGFALGVERVLIALAEQDAEPPAPQLDAVVGGSPAEAAFAAAAALRSAGLCVRLSGRSGIELAREAERSGAIEALWASGGGEAGELVVERLDGAGEPTGRVQLPAGGDAR